MKLDTALELIKGRWKVMKIKSAALESCKILSRQQFGIQCPYYFSLFLLHFPVYAKSCTYNPCFFLYSDDLSYVPLIFSLSTSTSKSPPKQKKKKKESKKSNNQAFISCQIPNFLWWGVAKDRNRHQERRSRWIPLISFRIIKWRPETLPKKAGIFFWKGKWLWLWGFVCGQKANVRLCVLPDFYMSKTGDRKRKGEIRKDVLKKGKELSILLKISIFNCLPPSLSLINLLTLLQECE